jgi:hypothetical protein
VPLPQQPIPAANPFPHQPQPQPQPARHVPVPLRTVEELNWTPPQPAIKGRFPKTWSNLLRVWHRSDCDSFGQADQRVWDQPLRQAFCKRRYLIDHLRVQCRTARGTTQEEREDAAAALLDQSKARKALYSVYNDLHRADAGIQRRQRRPWVEEEPAQQPAQQPVQQPARQPAQQPARQPARQQPARQPWRQRQPQRRRGPRQEQMFQNWAHPNMVNSPVRPARW